MKSLYWMVLGLPFLAGCLAGSPALRERPLTTDREILGFDTQSGTTIASAVGCSDEASCKAKCAETNDAGACRLARCWNAHSRRDDSAFWGTILGGTGTAVAGGAATYTGLQSEGTSSKETPGLVTAGIVAGVAAAVATGLALRSKAGASDYDQWKCVTVLE